MPLDARHLHEIDTATVRPLVGVTPAAVVTDLVTTVRRFQDATHHCPNHGACTYCRELNAAIETALADVREIPVPVARPRRA